MTAKSWMCVRCADAANLKGRRCAFTASGRFRKNNWNCETMIALRGAAFFRHRDDFVNGSIGVVEMPDETGPRDDVKGFLVLTWYKDRGGSPGATWLHWRPVDLDNMPDDDARVFFWHSAEPANVRRQEHGYFYQHEGAPYFTDDGDPHDVPHVPLAQVSHWAPWPENEPEEQP